MTQRIVLLNLGDRADGGGLIDKSAKSLEKKYPTKKKVGLFGGNKIDQFSLFDLLARSKQGAALKRADPELIRARMLCRKATKVMLCVHGLHNNVQSGFANNLLAPNQPMEAVCSYADLAALTLRVLPLREEVYNLALIMCYGARSENYRLDHQGQIDPADLKTSFAYRFFTRICAFRNVRMTARTGATGFDENTGMSTVESEAAVQARYESEEFLRLEETLNAINAYKTLKESHTVSAKGGSDERCGQWAALDRKFRENPDAVAATAGEQVVRAYHQILRTKRGYEDALLDQKMTKYGKYVYTYDQVTGNVTIFAKYPKPGRVLYSGPRI